eukprot:TRINITY_DN13082_c0_g1_i4.p4 TRINITY_DN13082_c0_g1~~TRINITY_DN13082_c0_g1_i4.p4  ORF type:complete len:111 (-),score=15.96 TRINITY_DN13082_c0_g1_i4:191-523(-)
MIRRPPRSTHCISSAASDVYKRQISMYEYGYFFRCCCICFKEKSLQSLQQNSCRQIMSASQFAKQSKILFPVLVPCSFSKKLKQWILQVRTEIEPSFFSAFFSGEKEYRL